MRACPSCGRENPGDSRYCNACGHALADPLRRREERKVVTVLFADLVGFTSRAERLDPEDVRALLAPYWEHLRADLARYGGTVEKFIGDAVMAVFGAPVAHEDDPERAVRAALAIRDWAREEADLQVRVAVNTGEALVLLDAHPAEGEGMAAGDVVNTAARLQSAAPINGVLVGDATYRATRGTIDYVSHEPVVAKGKSEPLAVWEALGARSRVTIEAISAAPLAGRTDEVELLVRALHRARRDAEPQLVTVAGVPGIGKSRLVAELFAVVERDPEFVIWRRGRSLSYGDGISLWALGEIVKAEVGVLESDTRDETAAKLARSLAEVADAGERSWLERHLAPLLGLPAEAADRTERIGAWRRWIELLAERRPLVLVFEDLQWADDELLDFVDELADWASDIPLLVLCTTRPEVYDRRPGWGGGKRNALTISLGPLSDTDTARIVAATLDRAVLPAETQLAVLERAAGNPLYAEQYARMVAEGARLDDLPETVQGIVAARLDLLPPDEKALLQDASVVGRAFWPAAIGATDDLLRSLARKEFVRRERRSSIAGEQEYSFAHALVRDVAYSQIPRADRAAKHRTAAEWIETLPPDRAVDHAELLAHHYGAAVELAAASGAVDADLRRRARDAFRAAGERARVLQAAPAACRHFEAALALTEPDDPISVDLLFGLGSAQMTIDPARAVATLPPVIATLADRGDLERAAIGEVTCAQAAWFAGDGDAAAAHAERAVALLEQQAPSEAKAEAVAQRARLVMLRGELRAADDLASTAIELAESLGLDRVRASALITRGAARGEEGMPDLELGIEIAERERDPVQLTRGLNNLAEAALYRGDLAGTLPIYTRYRNEALRTGARSFVIWVDAQEASVHAALGDWDRALEMAAVVLADVEAGNTNYMESEMRRERAVILHARGDTSGALDDGARALEGARKSKDPQTLVPAMATWAELLEREGRHVEARLMLIEALERLSGLEQLNYTFGPALVWPVLDGGMSEPFVRLFEANGNTDPWTLGTRACWRGDLEAAAETFAQHGALVLEADARLRLAAQLGAAGDRRAARELQRAASFFRSVGAARRLEEASALLAATG